jgi:hypothetical protein
VDKVNGSPTGWLADEILNQIALTRAQSGASGNVYFSMRTLMADADNLPRKLISGPYANRTLVPASPWLDSVAPLAPIVRAGWDASKQSSTLSLEPQGSEQTWVWLIRTRVSDGWTTDVVPGMQRFYTLPRNANSMSPDEVAVSAVDRTGNASAPVLVSLTPGH